MARAILYDSTLCIGCRECEKACAEKWGLPYNDNVAREEKLSAHKLTTIRVFGERFSRKLCMHCNEPTCASVCPVGAFTKTALGPVVYDADKCIGCRYCMQACPFQVPAYEWDKFAPRVRKCDMCYERQLSGKVTACTEACPVQATINGERDALLAEARKRLAEKPKDYYPRIYGLDEVGGTSVLMLSAVPFDQIGLKTNLPRSPLPPLTMAVLSMIPNIVSAGGVLLGGIYWLTHRKNAVARAERRAPEISPRRNSQ
jgi:formate dehydrogenase iron-sulfur subunit